MIRTFTTTHTESLAHGWSQFVWQDLCLPHDHWWVGDSEAGPIFMLWPVTSGWLCCSPVSDIGGLKGCMVTLKGDKMPSPSTANTVILAESVNILAALALVAQWRSHSGIGQIMVIGQWQANLPFQLQPSKFLTPDFPPEVTASIALLEDWSIPGRFCSKTWLPGTYEGDMMALCSHLAPNWRRIHAQWPTLADLSSSLNR